MASERIKPIDFAVAEFIGATSYLPYKYPDTIGLAFKSKAKSAILARWRHAHLASQSVKNWQEFDRYDQSGYIPSRYNLGAMIRIKKGVMDSYIAEYGGNQAVVYALGSTCIAGTLDDRPEFFGTDPLDDDYYAVGMGVGKGVLKAALGLRTEQGEVIIPPYRVSELPRPTIPVSIWPRSVPFV